MTKNSNTFEENEEKIYSQVDKQMSKEFVAGNWSNAEKIVLACRMLAQREHAYYLVGQITVRGNTPGTYWTTSFGSGLGNATIDTVVEFDETMQPLNGSPIPNPAVRFHVWVYKNRPDVNCIVHTHPPHTSALAMIGQELKVSHMDTSMFHDDCSYLRDWPGVPLANEEGQIISEALGDKRSLLLANHGLLTAGESIEEAVYLAIMFENAARLQLLASAAGTITDIDPTKAKEAHDFLLKKSIVNQTFKYWAEEVFEQYGESILKP